MPDAWKLGGMYEYFKEVGHAAFEEKGADYKVMPFSLFLLEFYTPTNDSDVFLDKNEQQKMVSEIIDAYFDYFESKWVNVKTTHVGFKILDQHFLKWPVLWEVLKARNYQALYLSRDKIRQVLSGVVAEHRGGGGAYNEINGKGFDGKITVDINVFKKSVQVEQFCADREIKYLLEHDIEYLPVTYDGFVDDREGFYRNIFEYLASDAVTPERTNYTVQIQRKLKNIIENHDDFVKMQVELGYKPEKTGIWDKLSGLFLRVFQRS